MQTTATNLVESDGRERIEALVTPDQKELLEQAAARRGLPLGDFISQTLEIAAATVAGDDNMIVLGPEDSTVFADALLNPPEPGSVLRAMAQRYGLTKPGEEPTS